MCIYIYGYGYIHVDIYIHIHIYIYTFFFFNAQSLQLRGHVLWASLGVRHCRVLSGNWGVNDIQALVIPSFLLRVPLSQDENYDWTKIIIHVSELPVFSLGW